MSLLQAKSRGRRLVVVVVVVANTNTQPRTSAVRGECGQPIALTRPSAFSSKHEHTHYMLHTAITHYFCFSSFCPPIAVSLSSRRLRRPCAKCAYIIRHRNCRYSTRRVVQAKTPIDICVQYCSAGGRCAIFKHTHATRVHQINISGAESQSHTHNSTHVFAQTKTNTYEKACIADFSVTGITRIFLNNHRFGLHFKLHRPNPQLIFKTR